MVKFKGRSNMKQYVKNKPIKWGFKFWYVALVKQDTSNQFDLHLGKEERAEENVGVGVVLKMTESIQNSYCMAFLIISATVPHL